MAPDRAAAIGRSGKQKNSRILDAIRGQDDDPARYPILVAVPTAVFDSLYRLLGVVELQLSDDALTAQQRAGLDRLLDMDDGFISRLGGAQRNTRRVSIAGW